MTFQKYQTYGRKYKMVGIDIIDIERVDGSDEFLNKIANEKEIEYVKKSFCDSLRIQRTGALFCVKEAVMKALDLGKGSGVVFKDIELTHQPSGKPSVILHGKALERLNQAYSGKRIEVSLSHTPITAIAIAIVAD